MTTQERVREAYVRIAEAARPDVWITLRDEADVLREAATIDARVADGEVLPLAGRLVAVKDNIDVAGLPTTAGCPAFAYHPAEHAPSVQRLVEAGTLIIGKTNMDQFATGLVGTRSPYGVVADARRPDRVAGGSSSGSAVAVALGLVDLALGTDTAGSGRVPAAFGGIVGLKPTYGLMPTRGVVPACRELDCVSVFARTVDEAELAATILTGIDELDPTSRPWPTTRPLAARPAPDIAVPVPRQLASLTPEARAAFTAAVGRLRDLGATVVEVDIDVLLTAGALLYGGAFVASRYAAVGAFIDAHRLDPSASVDPTVAQIISSAASVSATAWVADGERLDRLRLHAAELFAGVDALVLPTTTRQPKITEVATDPIGTNAALGEYTTFCNLLDLTAVAIPAGEADGGQFGISVIAPAFHDRVVADLARRFLDEPPLHGGPSGVPLVVVGAHLSGLPLNHQLTDRGARLIGDVCTAPVYRLYALRTEPPKPGLQRVAEGGATVLGELWDVPPAALAELLAQLPTPMAFGPVTLRDGTVQVGFQCEAVAVADATDITDFGSWRAYCAGGE